MWFKAPAQRGWNGLTNQDFTDFPRFREACGFSADGGKDGLFVVKRSFKPSEKKDWGPRTCSLLSSLDYYRKYVAQRPKPMDALRENTADPEINKGRMAARDLIMKGVTREIRPEVIGFMFEHNLTPQASSVKWNNKPNLVRLAKKNVIDVVSTAHSQPPSQTHEAF